MTGPPFQAFLTILTPETLRLFVEKVMPKGSIWSSPMYGTGAHFTGGAAPPLNWRVRPLKGGQHGQTFLIQLIDTAPVTFSGTFALGN